MIEKSLQRMLIKQLGILRDGRLGRLLACFTILEKKAERGEGGDIIIIENSPVLGQKKSPAKLNRGSLVPSNNGLGKFAQDPKSTQRFLK